MLNGVYQNAAAMTGLESWNNTIAQNLSQSSTPGYKKALISFEGVVTGKLGVQDPFGNTTYRPAVQTQGTGSVDFSNGPIQITDGEFDFAMEGDGFFELRAPDGQLVYTRDGQFKLNSDGELVSKQGFYVMDDTRNIIQIIPDGGKLQAATDGTLRQNGIKIAELGVRGVRDKSLMIRSNGGFVVVRPDENVMRHLNNPLVRHGALERSNVEGTTEMINLINVSRSFQINQRVIQQYDEVLNKAIRVLGGGIS